MRPIPLLAKIRRHGPAAAGRRFLQLASRNGWAFACRTALAELRRDPDSRGFDLEGYVYREGGSPEQAADEILRFARRPLISVVVPVFDTDPRWLAACIDSVRRQFYPAWELCLVDDGSTHPPTLELLVALRDPRIRLRRLERNSGICAATRAGLEMATGEFVALLDHDDELTRDALFEVAKVINEHAADFVYSDEDKLEPDGRATTPHFKPDYSPDLLLSQNYVCHLAVFRRSLLPVEGALDPAVEGSQDHDLFLRLVERAARVHHIPRILYHWRKSPGSAAELYDAKQPAWEAGRRAVQAALGRRGIEGRALLGPFPGTYRVLRSVRLREPVSIIIPFRDHPTHLWRCVSSIVERSTYADFEVLCLDHGSSSAEVAETIARLRALDPRVQVVPVADFPFNYSKLNNMGVERARGTHVCLLNSDTRIISPGWLEALLEHSQRPEVGAVGGRLYYPDDTIQHAGLILGLAGVANSSHHHAERWAQGYMWRPHVTQNVSAVTGACLMVRRAVYRDLGGLDEVHLPVAYNDVDFCLRLLEKGFLNVYTPYCELYHLEHATRGPDARGEARQRLEREGRYLRERHASVFETGDPHYNPNLTLERPGFRVAGLYASGTPSHASRGADVR